MAAQTVKTRRGRIRNGTPGWDRPTAWARRKFWLPLELTLLCFSAQFGALKNFAVENFDLLATAGRVKPLGRFFLQNETNECPVLHFFHVVPAVIRPSHDR